MGIRTPLASVVSTLILLVGIAFPAHASEITAEKERPLKQRRTVRPSVGVVEGHYGKKGPVLPPYATPGMLLPPVDAFNFDTNAALTGFVFIPPDPMVSVGLNHVLNIGNVAIEWRSKAGPSSGLVQQSLQTFFSVLPGPSTPVLPNETLGSFTFDPKCIYDQYADRFIVIALEQWDIVDGDPSDESRILVAVSKTSDPNDGWWYQAIYSKIAIGGSQTWADFPGIAIDDKAIYITANMFEFQSYPAIASASRLWIINKTPFYDGPNQSAVVTVHNPYLSAGVTATTQPAHMWGTPPSGLGTYLVSYSGLTAGGNEFVQVIEVSDPLGASGGPNFSQQFVAVGNIDNTDIGLPDAPQADTTRTIEVNDRRALNAVWRDNSLYLTATIVPVAAPDAGQTTAYWWEIDTSGGQGSWVWTQQTAVGAEDLGAGTFTFFPAVTVDFEGNVAVGFSASNSGMYCGAYYAAQQFTDSPGTMQNTLPLAIGEDWYVRTFGGSRNRWGDYSGLALDPIDEAVFWVYNEYACPRGTPLLGEDGRWCTKLGPFRVTTTPTGVPNTPDNRDLTLDQNYPNPFNPTTSIRFSLTVGEYVSISVYDVRGRLVSTLVDGMLPPGDNFVMWDGTNHTGAEVGTGVYFYRLTAGGFEQTRKMMLLK